MIPLSLTEALTSNSLEHKLEAQIKAALDADEESGDIDDIEKSSQTEGLSQGLA